MAGGPSTPALAVAVSEAGGLGFVAAGYRAPDQVKADLDAVAQRSGPPLIGLNLFVPGPDPGNPGSYGAYLEQLEAEAERAGVELGQPRHDDDAYRQKLELAVQAQPAVVSFTFGCPAAEDLAGLKADGSECWVTVTSPEEAEQAAAAGADALIVQGYEAGGHRGSFSDGDQEAFGLIALLQLVARSSDLPLVATGGIASGAGLAAVLAAGAQAAQIGTAFMRCPEAATLPAHADALASPTPTATTRAFTGRTARGLRNRFLDTYSDAAPAAYPELHHVTAPLRAAARARGEIDVVNLWAGQAHQLVEALPAAEVVERLIADAQGALKSATARIRQTG